MRLIDTKTLELHEFFDKNIPTYAILSHRWEDDEVSFEDFHRASRIEKRGWCKIQRFCELAKRSKYRWCWIDTCCIDKSSSAELSEAINAMYSWYSNSVTCYAFLCDVTFSSKGSGFSKQLENSMWFKRGWTLQELLAPKHVAFYDKNWRFLGDKNSLERVILKVTGIERRFLFSPTSASIAQRMYWASHRETSRAEDTAYCLLGLFEINMPLLYGEGAERAFYRLQLELLKSDDETIFAWDCAQPRFEKTGLLARSLKDFSSAGRIVVCRYFRREAYDMTNKGLRMTLRLIPNFPYNQLSHLVYSTALNCRHDDTGENLSIILLSRLDQNAFCRVGPLLSKLELPETALLIPPRKRTIYVPQRDTHDPQRQMYSGWSTLCQEEQLRQAAARNQPPWHDARMLRLLDEASIRYIPASEDFRYRYQGRFPGFDLLSDACNICWNLINTNKILIAIVKIIGDPRYLLYRLLILLILSWILYRLPVQGFWLFDRP